MTAINTSRAQEVAVNIKNIDNIPLSLKLKDKSGETPTDINLTQYGFDFILMKYREEVKMYSIAVGATTSTYLIKQDTSNTVLNMQAMWEDIQSVIGETEEGYRLVMKVTRPDDTKFVFINYTINGSKY